MLRILLPALLALTCPLTAQRLAVGINDQPAGLPGTVTSPSVQAFYYKVTRAMLIVGTEFWCGATSGTCSVHLFADDTSTTPSRPGTMLASATFNAPAKECWAGALFSKPVPVTPNTVLWLGWGMAQGGKTPQVGRSTAAPTYYWTRNLPPSWNGPYGPPKQSTGFQWMYRIYEAGGTGKFTAFGTASAGSYGAIDLTARGWPNLGNSFTLVAAKLKDQSSGLLVWGRRAGINLPPWSLYAFPPLFLQGFATGGGKNQPEAEIFVNKLPQDPALVGATMAWQLWMLDPGGPGGLAHSAGLEVLIG